MNVIPVIFRLIERLKTVSNFRNALIFTVFSFLNNGVNFGLIMVLAAFLSPAGYGTLNLFNTAIIVITILIPLGTTGFVANSYFRKDDNGLKQVLNVVFLVGTCTFIFLLSIVFFAGESFKDILGFSLEFQFIVMVICFSQLFTTVNLEIWRLQEKPVKYGLYTMGVVSLNCILTLYFIVICDWDWEGRVYAQLIVSLIFLIVSLSFLIYRKLITWNKINKKILIETLKYGGPLIPHMLTNWMRQGLDRYIINIFLGVSSVGIFSFALNFGNIILMVGTAFNASNAVFIFKQLASKDTDTLIVLRKQTKIIIVFFLCFSLLVYLGAFFLIPLLFPKYTDSLPILLPLCLSATFQCIYLLYVNYLFYYKKTKSLMYITVAVSLVHIALSYTLSKYSLLYIAYIHLFSNFVICIITVYYSKKILKSEYSLK